MADIRESFPTLEDVSGVGAPLSKSQSGDAAAGKVGSTAFAFRDSSGNLILPQLDSNGAIVVNTEGASGVEKKAAALVAGSASEVDVAEIVLTVNKTYNEIMAHVSCFRDAIYRLVQVDDATTTELDYALCGSGQYTNSMGFVNLKITAGATGTQKIIVKAKNLNVTSDFRAAITCLELL